jgi:hypothetical protein
MSPHYTQQIWPPKSLSHLFFFYHFLHFPASSISSDAPFPFLFVFLFLWPSGDDGALGEGSFTFGDDEGLFFGAAGLLVQVVVTSQTGCYEPEIADKKPRRKGFGQPYLACIIHWATRVLVLILVLISVFPKTVSPWYLQSSRLFWGDWGRGMRLSIAVGLVRVLIHIWFSVSFMRKMGLFVMEGIVNEIKREGLLIKNNI